MLCRPFLRIHYQDLKGFGEHIDGLITRLLVSEGMVDLQPYFFRFTLATTTALIFGQPRGGLEIEVWENPASSFDHASWTSSLRSRLQDALWVYNLKGNGEYSRVFQAFAGTLMKWALREYTEKPQAGTSNGHLHLRFCKMNFMTQCLCVIKSRMFC